jgi:ribokinase
MIHVVGNLAIDTIFRVARFPLPGETVAAIDSREAIGGKGANQAVVIARTGCAVGLAAAVGAADLATLSARLRAEGVDPERLWAFDGPTDRSSIYVDDTGENTIVSATPAARAYDPIAAGALAAARAGDIVLCQGNLRPQALIATLQAAREAGAMTILNPSPVFDVAGLDWSLTDLVVVNQVEARALAGEDDPSMAAEALRASGAGAVVVTLGRGGAILSGAETVTMPAPTVSAVDTAGAGDVFCGMLVAGRALGRGFAEAMAAAVAAAALSVTRQGVMESFPTAAEAEGIMAEAAEGAGR